MDVCELKASLAYSESSRTGSIAIEKLSEKAKKTKNKNNPKNLPHFYYYVFYHEARVLSSLIVLLQWLLASPRLCFLSIQFDFLT